MQQLRWQARLHLRPSAATACSAIHLLVLPRELLTTGHVPLLPASAMAQPAVRTIHQKYLVNNTAAPINVTYNYSLLTANGCTNIQPVMVTVNPSPVLSTTLTPPGICSGTNFDYVPQSNTVNAVFSWNRALVPSITNGAGAGINNPSELLVNSSNIPVDIPYIFHTSANGCTSDQVVTVTVNPTPIVFNQSTIVCSGNRSSSHLRMCLQEQYIPGITRLFHRPIH
jgi:hypothetical protein